MLGIALSRIEGKPLADVLSERIFEPLGMADTGFSVGPTGGGAPRRCTSSTTNGTLQHDVMGPAPITDPPFCTGGAGLWSTVDDYLRFARMLLGGGALDGVRVLSEESVRLMRTDRLTDEQKRHTLSRDAVLDRPRLRAEPVGGDRPREVPPAVRPGRTRHVQVAGRLRHVVAGRPVGGPDPAST